VTVSTTQAPQAFRYVDPYEYDQAPMQTQVRRPAAPNYNGGGPAPYPPYYYGGYYGGYYPGWYGPAYPYWGWGGFGGGIVIGHGGFRRFR
jgi:hypothetical protein